MFSNEALELLENPEIFQKLKKVISFYVLENEACPSVRSLFNMVEFMSANPCICNSGWKVFINSDKLFKLDLTLGISMYVNLTFHKDNLIEYKIKMPDDEMDDVLIYSGKDSISTFTELLNKSGISAYIESGNSKDTEN